MAHHKLLPVPVLKVLDQKKDGINRISTSTLDLAKDGDKSSSKHSKSFSSEEKPKKIRIFLKIRNLKKITLLCDPEVNTILEIKECIQKANCIPSAQQKLYYSRQELQQDDQNLTFYKIKHKSTLHLHITPSIVEFESVPPTTLPIIDLPLSLRSPEFDFDYSDLDDTGMIFKRGDYRYRRPLGWKRIALNINRYGEDKSWLGPPVRNCPTRDSPGEWPVSFHGTVPQNTESIAKDGFLLCKGVRFLHGLGIYTTPDLEVAELFASKFQFEGSEYKVVIQSRVNPDTMKRVVIEDPLEYWISGKETDVRPYALCIKKCSGEGDRVEGGDERAQACRKILRRQRHDIRPGRRPRRGIVDGCKCV